jgi:hypothetical protein
MASSNVKTVRVSVQDGTIVCTPDPVPVSGAQVLLVFRLDTPGYAFPETDAVVVAPSVEEFPYTAWQQNASTAALFDRNRNAGDHAYTLSLVDTRSGQTLRHDPTIRNEGR